MTFSALMSPWQTPCAWHCCSALSSWNASQRFSTLVRKGGVDMRSSRLEWKNWRTRKAACGVSLNQRKGMTLGAPLSVSRCLTSASTASYLASDAVASDAGVTGLL